MEVTSLYKVLKKVRVNLSTEKEAQASLEKALKEESIAFLREHRLSASDIPDFMVGTICIEMKIKGSAREIYRQLERYTQYESVSSIILMTNKGMNLPAMINNKPAYIIKLGTAWL